MNYKGFIFAGLLFLCFLVKAWSKQPVWINDGKSPVISEFMASNSSSLFDDDNEAPDWCEIHNPTNAPINLYGWFLSDNNDRLYKWRFPEIILQPGAYQVVFLSGKDEISNLNFLHANFKLEASGENLILSKPDGTTKVWYFEGSYPVQFNDVSYGSIGLEYHYLKTATPGKVNIGDFYIAPPGFSVQRGYFKEPFTLELSVPESGVEIYYTLDCSTPNNRSIRYSEPILINTTTVVRAVGYSASGEPGASSTATYIFLGDVVRQPVLPPGYPAQWGPFTTISGNAPGDYEMDPEVCNDPVYKSQIEAAFNDLPVVSIVTDIGYLFSSSKDPLTGGIYYYTGAPKGSSYDLGKDWERPASVEYFNKEKDKGFQANIKLQLNGGHSRLPEKCPKHSFRLHFVKEYGIGRLNFPLFEEKSATESFDRLILRGGFGNSWLHVNSSERRRAQYIRDCWAKDAFRAMGHPSAHNQYAHVFLNGLYWGVYSINERMDDEFMVSYLGGNAEDYDVIKDYSEVLRGNDQAWNAMWKQATSDMTKIENYQKILGRNPDGTENPLFERLLDEVNLVDYILLNIYGGNNDWDHHNWVAARNRTSRDGYKFFPWDSERIFDGLNDNVTSENNSNCPSGIFQRLAKNPEFKMLIADRVYKHFFNQGVLTPAAAMTLWNDRADQVQLAIICESARWGDYRRDAHRWTSNVHRLYTLNGDWIPAQNSMLNELFPNRTNVVVQQLKQAGLYPNLDPPAFMNAGSIKKPGDKLALYSPLGNVYYTVDGSDPRSIGGQVSTGAKAYSVFDSISIPGSIVVKARTYQNNVWSALATHEFDLGSATINQSLALQNNSLEFRILPNPARDYLNIQYRVPISSDVKIEMYTLTGLKIATIYKGLANIERNQLIHPVENLKRGVYLCRIEANGRSIVQKIHIIR